MKFKFHRKDEKNPEGIKSLQIPFYMEKTHAYKKFPGKYVLLRYEEGKNPPIEIVAESNTPYSLGKKVLEIDKDKKQIAGNNGLDIQSCERFLKEHSGRLTKKVSLRNLSKLEYLSLKFSLWQGL